MDWLAKCLYVLDDNCVSVPISRLLTVGSMSV